MKTTQKIKLLDFKLSKSIGNLLFGVYKSRFSGSGMDFSDHKEYEFGDAVKSIDWKASAKGEKILSKVFETEKHLKVLFLIDMQKSLFFELESRKKLDIVEEVFYALSFSALQNNDSVGTYAFGNFGKKYFPYKKDIGNIFKVLDYIGNTGNAFSKIDNLGTILTHISTKKLKDNLIFIVSDSSSTSDYLHSLKNLSVENEIIFIQVSDYFEKNLGNLPETITFENASDFVHICTQNEEKREEYRKLIQQKQEIFEKSLKKYKIPLISLDTKMDVFKELIRKL